MAKCRHLQPCLQVNCTFGWEIPTGNGLKKKRITCKHPQPCIQRDCQFGRKLKYGEFSTGSVCCIPNCPNRAGRDKKYRLKHSYYRFPNKDPVRLAVWIEALPPERTKNGWKPTANTRICNAHFVGGAKTNTVGSPGYIPTIWPKENRSKYCRYVPYSHWATLTTPAPPNVTATATSVTATATSVTAAATSVTAAATSVTVTATSDESATPLVTDTHSEDISDPPDATDHCYVTSSTDYETQLLINTTPTVQPIDHCYINSTDSSLIPETNTSAAVIVEAVPAPPEPSHPDVFISNSAEPNGLENFMTEDEEEEDDNEEEVELTEIFFETNMACPVCLLTNRKPRTYHRLDIFLHHWREVHEKELFFYLCPVEACFFDTKRLTEVNNHILHKHCDGNPKHSMYKTFKNRYDRVMRQNLDYVPPLNYVFKGAKKRQGPYSVNPRDGPPVTCRGCVAKKEALKEKQEALEESDARLNLHKAEVTQLETVLNAPMQVPETQAELKTFICKAEYKVNAWLSALQEANRRLLTIKHNIKHKAKSNKLVSSKELKKLEKLAELRKTWSTLRSYRDSKSASLYRNINEDEEAVRNLANM